MNKRILPLAITTLFALALLAPAAQAAPKLRPGSYNLQVEILTGEAAGTKLSGTCNVAAKILSYSLRLPKGFRPSRVSGKATHNGRARFNSNANIGRITITVIQASRTSARGTFANVEGTGTWTLKRR